MSQEGTDINDYNIFNIKTFITFIINFFFSWHSKDLNIYKIHNWIINWSVLDHAVKLKFVEIVRILISQENLDINHKNILNLQ